MIINVKLFSVNSVFETEIEGTRTDTRRSLIGFSGSNPVCIVRT